MTSYSPKEFVDRLVAMNAGVGRIPLEGITASSKLVKESILALTPARLSGVKRGGKLGVQYRIGNWGSEGSQSVISATGPFQLIERSTRPHEEPRVRRRGGPRHYAVLPDGGVFSHVQHPGTKGKHPFERGTDAAIPACRKYFQVSTASVIKSLI